MDKQNEGQQEIKVITASGVDVRDMDYLYFMNAAAAADPDPEGTQALFDTLSKGDVLFAIDVPQTSENPLVDMLTQPDQPLGAVHEFIKAYNTGETVPKEKAMEIIGGLINQVMAHRYFQLWCNSSRAMQIETKTHYEFVEVERLVEAIRFCFFHFIHGRSDDEIFWIIDEFSEKWEIPMFDMANEKIAPLPAGIHSIRIRTDNPQVSLFVYSNEPEMKA